MLLVSIDEKNAIYIKGDWSGNRYHTDLGEVKLQYPASVSSVKMHMRTHFTNQPAG